MSTNFDQCEENFCSSERVFPCLYHCKKMLCIQHLSNHEQQIRLEQLWNSYCSFFNETKVQEEYERLKKKLENHQQLKLHVESSLENNDQIQRTIEMIECLMEQETQLKSIDDHKQENLQSIDYPSISSSITTNDESEMIDSLSNHNGCSPEQTQFEDQFDEDENSIESEKTDKTSHDPSDNKENHLTPNRNLRASRIRGCCPLTKDGAFGINSSIHGIRLCPEKSTHSPRTYRLNEHFRRVHQLTPLASLAVARAICTGQDPMTTRLFNNHQIILNIEELRNVFCPIHKPFIHHPSIELLNYPCYETKQVRQLKIHLRRVHGFTHQAAGVIIKAVKADKPVHAIQFPHWVNITENNSHF